MKYFKTDGIRGEAYTELTLDLAYKIGLYFNKTKKRVALGVDTRESSPEIAYAIYKGLKEKVDAHYAGIIPTPGLMYYSMKNECIGIMITASHNLYKDNGIKIFDCGKKISKEIMEEIEYFIDKNETVKYKEEYYFGDLEIDKNIVDEYVSFLKERLKGITKKVLFDGANGAFSYILKELFDYDNLINCSPNGKNINLNCGSTDVTGLIHELKLRHHELGIAFDGDGDRMIVVDKYNRVYQGDLLTYFYAVNLNEKGQLDGKTVVLTEITNPGILDRLTQIGLYPIIVSVGDQNVSAALNNGYVLGGESCGHIINKTILPFSDGLCNAIELIKILESTPKQLHEYLYDIKMYFYKNVNIKINENTNLSEKTKNKINRFVKRRKIHLITRYSGTEKVLRLYVYQKKVNKIESNISKIMKIINNDIR